jgi:hypothetical protein
MEWFNVELETYNRNVMYEMVSQCDSFLLFANKDITHMIVWVYGHKEYLKCMKPHETNIMFKEAVDNHCNLMSNRVLWKFLQERRLSTFVQMSKHFFLIPMHWNPICTSFTTLMRSLIHEANQWRARMRHFLCTRKGRNLIGAGALYPIQHMLRDFDIGESMVTMSTSFQQPPPEKIPRVYRKRMRFSP